MPNVQKKIKSEQKYVVRNQAIRKLQISLAQFRRLCILKGIYPVEPKNKRKLQEGNSQLKTWYYKKDIQRLMHEPILQTLRDEKTHEKKLTKALNRQEWTIANLLKDEKPFYTLHHVIKERYPTFIDALRDLDDALSMICLFSTLPVDEKVDQTQVKECQRLWLEFQHYLILTGSIRKTFLSIKGIYYQAEIKGQTITWITPYQFSQTMPHDVDFRVMGTFLEIYQVLLSFVNYKLYQELNLVYPPAIDAQKDENAGGLNALVLAEKDQKQVIPETKSTVKPTKEFESRVKSLESKLSGLDQEDQDEEMEEEVEEDKIEPVVEPQNAQERLFSIAQAHKPTLFSKCVFYLSREVPRYSLELVIKAFGGKVGWDQTAGHGSPFQFDDNRITHHIVDRPATQTLQGREYLQPQWVYDSINAGYLVKSDGYRPGEKLPPHLSPFVVPDEDEYDPTKEPAEEKEEESASDKESDHEEEQKELAKMMMKSRDKKLYQKLEAQKKQKQEKAKKLVQKRKSKSN